MAVEMAKLSLWLVTLQRDRPFTFLDHALRHGDSLVGVNVQQLLGSTLVQRETVQGTVFRPVLQRALHNALRLRHRIEGTEDLSVRDTQEKEGLLRQSDEALGLVRLGADLLVSTAFLPRREPASTADMLLYRFQLLVHAAEEMGSGAWKEHVLAQHRQDFGNLRAEADCLLKERKPFHWPLEFPEVFVDEASFDTPVGFDALLGNPPFLGGKKITGALGTAYRDYLVEHIGRGKRGHADLCAYFFLRGESLLRRNGQFGMLATNTIAQGDTREVGLEQITENGGTITRALPSRKWPGTANLEVAEVWVRRGEWHGTRSLADTQVPGITPFLTTPGKVAGNPYHLAANAGKSYIGSYVLGMGFVLSTEDAEALIQKDPRNRDVLFPYLNGEDLNSRPDQSPSRWVINFHDWPKERAKQYPDCWRIIEDRVRPERQRTRDDGEYALRKPLPQRYWQYADKRPALYATIARMGRVMVRARVSEHHMMVFVPNNLVMSEAIVVLPFANWEVFSLFQSTIHELWARAHASSLETRMRYTPSDCIETFPWPRSIEGLRDIGASYYLYRARMCEMLNEGLTSVLNRFHSPDENDERITALRDLHIRMDCEVQQSYGWNDLDLQYGFYETKRGIRFTISEPAREEVRSRLLALNHERYEEEVR